MKRAAISIGRVIAGALLVSLLASCGSGVLEDAARDVERWAMGRVPDTFTVRAFPSGDRVSLTIITDNTHGPEWEVSFMTLNRQFCPGHSDPVWQNFDNKEQGIAVSIAAVGYSDTWTNASIVSVTVCLQHDFHLRPIAQL